jgi:hypothetical protein
MLQADGNQTSTSILLLPRMTISMMITTAPSPSILLSQLIALLE